MSSDQRIDGPADQRTSGVLVVDKPAGPTSHDVVARVRRAIGISRIGHTGTLDPLATGVLALLVGRATRLAQFLAADEKEYLAGVRLGWSTPTYDAEARTARSDQGELVVQPPDRPAPPVTRDQVLAALPAFRGTYAQLPPPFSAKKIDGTPAYKLARRKQDVELKRSEVTVRALELLDYADGLLTLRIVCSSGFYVRSLAHDLGTALGCGAHLESLRRTRAGDFRIEGATALAVVQEEGRDALARLIPLGALLSGLPRVVVNQRGAKRAAHGNALALEDLSGDAPEAGLAAGAGSRVRVVDGDGALLAIGEPGRGGLLQPVVVLV